MPLKPPPRLAQQASPDPGDPMMPAPGDSNGDPATNSQGAPESQQDPGALEDAQNILLITAAARKMANKYTNVVPEVQTINDAVQKMQMKIMQTQPQPQVPAPPQ